MYCITCNSDVSATRRGSYGLAPKHPDSSRAKIQDLLAAVSPKHSLTVTENLAVTLSAQLDDTLW